MFKKSTRSIVAGRKPKTPEIPAKQVGDTFVACTPTDDTGHQKTQEANVMRIPKMSRQAVTALNAAGAFILLISIIVLILVQLSHPASEKLPEIAEGQVIASVEASTALTSAVNAGDIVRLYSADGQPLPELQYVQVYQDTADAGLLILVDDIQAAALLGQSEIQAVLVVHNDSKRAEELLALQARINNPQVILTVQPTAVLAPGETLELDTAAEIDPIEAVLPAILWTSSDPTVATVDDGIVTAQAVGQAEITASCGGVEAVCQVTVEIPLKEIHLSQTEVILAIDDKLQLTADADPADATGFAVTWSVEDSEVATVSEDGTVTAVAVGTTTVTASCGEISASCTVTVGVHAEMAQLDAQELTVAVGESASLTVAVYPSSGVIDKMIFESSDPEIATVSEDGVVTGAARGTATISFRCGEATASCTVTVTAATK